MKHVYKKTYKIEYNKSLFQVVVREDKGVGFFKIIVDGNETKYEYPSAFEFLHLSSLVNTNNRIKF
ncbi:MAG TPA: hypothetical protein PLB45_03085 [Bacilli bacterium]|jgi:hypothetical protein|nr:hypothetical protein [Bacilli bacterium]HQC83837.1 hypothetical protein [Bacilli bacterium]